jgi:putative transposase
VTPVVTMSGRRSGRLSVAGLIAMRPGSRTRLCHRLRTHPAGKGTRRSMGEQDFIASTASISWSERRSCWSGTA